MRDERKRIVRLSHSLDSVGILYPVAHIGLGTSFFVSKLVQEFSGINQSQLIGFKHRARVSHLSQDWLFPGSKAEPGFVRRRLKLLSPGIEINRQRLEGFAVNEKVINLVRENKIP